MKITLEQVAENGNSVSSAIEAACKDHDSIASGVIGPSFACSGPGSGWQRNYDASDYAERALSGDYGASSYIDSSDGREATLRETKYWVDTYSSGSVNTLSGPFDTLTAARAIFSDDIEVDIEPYNGTVEKLSKHGDVSLVEAYSSSEDSEDYTAIYQTGGELEWSDESVIELVCPSLEDALDNPDAAQAMLAGLATHGEDTDLDAWEALEDEIEKANADTHHPRVRDAMQRIDGTPTEDGKSVIYYDDNMNQHYLSPVADLLDLADLMASDDEDVARDAYSHWCSGVSHPECDEHGVLQNQD